MPKHTKAKRKIRKVLGEFKRKTLKRIKKKRSKG